MATTDEIFDYVMTNPYNTNPNQLRTMLDSVSSGGGSSTVLCELITSTTSDVVSAEMTAEELYSAAQEGKTIVFHSLVEGAEPLNYYFYVSFVSLIFGTYTFSCNQSGSPMNFTATSPDGHPSMRMD